jgi:hypothetical protein
MLSDAYVRALSLSLLVVSVAWIGTMTFLPLVLPSSGTASASSFLLVSGLLIAVGRWAAGAVTDRAAALVSRFPWIVVVTASGLGLLTLSTSPLLYWPRRPCTAWTSG